MPVAAVIAVELENETAVEEAKYIRLCLQSELPFLAVKELSVVLGLYLCFHFAIHSQQPCHKSSNSA